MTNHQVVLGIDIGGTNTVYGLVCKDGKVYGNKKIDTNGSLPASDLVNRIVLDIEKFFTINQKMDLIGIGIGAPNANYLTGIIENPPNLKWGDVNIVELFKERYNIDTLLTNDANAAALGEKNFGIAKNMDDFVLVTLGTGLGSGIFSGGKLIYGHNGLAGEMGHMIIERNGRICNCGNRGCLESYVSANGLIQTVKMYLDENPNDKFLQSINSCKIDGNMLDREFDERNKMVRKIYEYTGEKLGIGLAQVVTLLNPEAFIFYGGLSNAGDRILQYAKKSMNKNLINNHLDSAELLLSELPEGQAGIQGAASLVWSNK